MLEGAGINTKEWDVDRFAIQTDEGGLRYRWKIIIQSGDVLHPVEREIDLGGSHNAATTALGVFYTAFQMGLNHSVSPDDDLRRQQIFAHRNARAFEREWRLWSSRATDLGIRREKIGENPNDIGLQLRDE
jgi:hypothetical protein